MSQDLIDKQLNKGSVSNPVKVIMECVQSMNHLKNPRDPKLNMSVEYLQGQISRAVMQMTVKKPQRQNARKAVNQNVPTKH